MRGFGVLIKTIILGLNSSYKQIEVYHIKLLLNRLRARCLFITLIVWAFQLFLDELKIKFHLNCNQIVIVAKASLTLGYFLQRSFNYNYTGAISTDPVPTISLPYITWFSDVEDFFTESFSKRKIVIKNIQAMICYFATPNLCNFFLKGSIYWWHKKFV